MLTRYCTYMHTTEHAHDHGQEKRQAALAGGTADPKEVVVQVASASEQIRDILGRHALPPPKTAQTKETLETRDNGVMGMMEKATALEELSVAGLSPDQQADARIAWKKNDIRNMDIEIAERASQAATTVDATGTTEERMSAMHRGYEVREDLSSIDITESFYDPYCDILKMQPEERGPRMEELKRSLQSKLNAAAASRGGSGDAYNVTTTERIIAGLTRSEQLDRHAYSLLQRRCVTALEIDKNQKTDISGHIREIATRTDIPTGERLNKIDAVLGEVEGVQSEDPEMKKKAGELKKDGDRAKAAQNGAEVKKSEEKIDAQAKKEKTAEKIKTQVPQFKALPPKQQESVLGHVENGSGDMIQHILSETDFTTEETADGSFAARLEGETVFLDNTNGSMTAFIRAGDEKIPIPLTDPNATGFDIARGKKEILERGWTDIADSEEIILAFIDQPHDESFANAEQIDKFGNLLQVIFKHTGVSGRKGLQYVGLMDDNGLFRKEYAGALKQTLERWAPDGNFDALARSVQPDDIRTLVGFWKRDAGGGTSGSFRSYSLEEVKAGRD